MKELRYVYDAHDDYWCAYWGTELLVSVSRENVCRAKLERYDNQVNEYQVFREMFGEILLRMIENNDNEFFIGACLTKLFKYVI